MRRFLAITLIVLVFVTACGKKQVKQQSQDSKIATEAFKVVEDLRQAYIMRDLKTVENDTTREGYRTIVSAMKSFDSVELSFNPAWVEIEDSTVTLNVSWRGKWQKENKTTDERGMAVFILKGRPLKVDNILRSNPFVHPE